MMSAVLGGRYWDADVRMEGINCQANAFELKRKQFKDGVHLVAVVEQTAGWQSDAVAGNEGHENDGGVVNEP